MPSPCAIRQCSLGRRMRDGESIFSRTPTASRILPRVTAPDAAALAVRLRMTAVRWARSYVDEQDAEDVAQDALALLLERAAGVEPEAAVAFVRSAVWKVASSHRRRRRREEPGTPAAVDDAPSPEDTLASAEVSEEMRAALARMPESRRRVVVDVVTGDRPLADVAAEQSAPESTVRSRLAADVEELRGEMHRRRVAEKRRTGGHASWALLPFLDVRAYGRRALALLGATAAVVAVGGARLYVPPLNPTPEERPAAILALDTVRPITPLPAAVRGQDAQPVSVPYKFAPRARHDASRHFAAVRFGR